MKDTESLTLAYGMFNKTDSLNKNKADIAAWVTLTDIDHFCLLAETEDKLRQDRKRFLSMGCHLCHDRRSRKQDQDWFRKTLIEPPKHSKNVRFRVLETLYIRLDKMNSLNFGMFNFRSCSSNI